MTRVEQMRRHVEDLCAEHGIEVRSHSRGGRASVTGRWVQIRPVKSGATYLTALHEIGHVVADKSYYRRLEGEVAAFMWMADNVIVDPGEFAWSRQASFLTNYLAWAATKRARGVSNAPVIPDSIWVALERLYSLAGGVVPPSPGWQRALVAVGLPAEIWRGTINSPHS